ncbi:vacuolar protein sorting-associated protein-like protein [Leishmania major strain Friedlin]|uniref:Vacuolar protein sorting-associated protein 28 homolog n=1 Tax=Leishmania major TaxID=5664 RepID=Q4Q0P5_LEIMA|nr:vacuolar protein sorting-associated protein-like protein [Leishmania major strain Friedlin]CAG9584069.1 vacuolar_protein_sorting-associated_protein-like_protein [Leishmania major strain Friedlin]CAJ09489.1 vacuolar protein sorting-associated protein-like protein [Leishmania major strain Friedlin]|eukprot:XP_001687103.1 vacuolar protein sorting-associated protein-like protein [Leishmania major strain Friedlin]
MASIEIPPEDRQHIDYLADLFAVIIAIEQIEKANRRDLINPNQYDSTVRRLLEKYKNTVAHLQGARNPYFTTIDDFFDKYCARCLAARATIRDGPMSRPTENNARFLARQSVECSDHFITLLDSLRLQQTSVDVLNPPLGDLLQVLRKLGLSKEDFYMRLHNWQRRLDSMSAADMLDESAARDFAYDLDRGYACFKAFLESDPTLSTRR